MTRRRSTTKGFTRAVTLMQSRIRAAGEKRGFAVARLLTHWEEIAGADIARIASPVKVSYGRGGVAPILTVLTTGAQAPMLQMQLPLLRDKVNACYGYNAISQIRVTQTAPTGFAEGQAAFAPASKPTRKPPTPEAQAAARVASKGVADDDLRAALEALGANVLTRSTQRRSTT